MRKRVLLIICAVLAAGLIFSVSMVLNGQKNYRDGGISYSKAAEVAGIPSMEHLPQVDRFDEPEETGSASETEYTDAMTETPSTGEASDTLSPETATTPTESEPPVPVTPLTFEEIMLSVDLDALRQYNPDVIGWIGIPGTAISYPVLQGSDNEQYLNMTWNKVHSSVGSIFMEHTAQADMSDFNTIIYGHKVGNGTMFNGLLYYNNDDYLRRHPEVYILTDEGLLCYDIFASFETDTSSVAYGIEFVSDAAKMKCITNAVECSVVNSDITPTVDDRILTLSTCSTMFATSKRWVVQAVLSTEKSVYFD